MGSRQGCATVSFYFVVMVVCDGLGSPLQSQESRDEYVWQLRLCILLEIQEQRAAGSGVRSVCVEAGLESCQRA
jgi:hypothetical protein